MYVEICCADRQLPAILKEDEVFFNTSGDITIQHIMKAASCLAGQDIEMTLMADEVTDDICYTIRHYVNSGWVKKINLFVKTDCKKSLKSNFEGITNIINYAVDENLNDNLIAFDGSDGAVLIVGKMLTKENAGFYTYCGRRFVNMPLFDDLMEPFRAKFKSKIKKI